ncbi:MAG: hypothetical protein WCG12_20865, partial [Alcaligenaceae bacterium]
MIDTIIRSDRVVTPQGVGAYDIAVSGETIVAVAAVGAAPRAALYIQSSAAKEEAGNGNGSIEPGECG